MQGSLAVVTRVDKLKPRVLPALHVPASSAGAPPRVYEVQAFHDFGRGETLLAAEGVERLGMVERRKWRVGLLRWTGNCTTVTERLECR